MLALDKQVPKQGVRRHEPWINASCSWNPEVPNTRNADPELMKEVLLKPKP